MESRGRLLLVGGIFLLSVTACGRLESRGRSSEGEVPALAPSSETAAAAPLEDPQQGNEDHQTLSRASIAVLDFTFHASLRPETHREFNSALLTDRVVTALSRLRKFSIVERQRVGDLLREYKFSEQGFTSKRKAVEAGELIGADYFVFGSVHRMGVSSKVEDIPYTTEKATVSSGNISGNIRVVNSRTGEIAASWPLQVSSRDRDAAGGSEASLDSLQTRFAELIARAIVDAVYPIKVASVGSDGRVYLNAGEGRGLSIGDAVQFCALGSAIVDPDTGEELGREESCLATGRITETAGRVVVARATRGAASLAPGMLVRGTAGRESTAATEDGGGTAPAKLQW